MEKTAFSASQAAKLIRADHDLLLDRVVGLDEGELRAPSRLDDGPLGRFCESLHDLVAHVLMWSEINLAVLHEARAGRIHWSIEPRWETPEMGAALNRTGVASGREFPTRSLVDRLVAVRDALTADVAREWDDPDSDVGPIVQRAMTPDGAAPYAHAALHLGVHAGSAG